MKTQATQRVLSIMLAVSLVASLQLAAVPFALADEGATALTTAPQEKASMLSVASWEALTQAVAEAPEGETTISVEANILVDAGAGMIVVPAGKSIMLAGVDVSIESSDMVSTMFKVEEGATLALAAGLTLNGGDKCSIVDSQGTVVLDGAEICQTKSYAVKVAGNNAAFTGISGSISYNKGAYYNNAGLVVLNGATATLENISIHHCENSRSGSAALFIQNAEAVMNGGKIENNLNNSDYTSAAGAVCVRAGGIDAPQATFTFNGGTIANNKGYRGGGVYVEGADGYDSSALLDSYAEFVMNGGTIEGNEAAQAGGGVWVVGNAAFKLNDGTISNNIAQSFGGGVATFDQWTVFYGTSSYKSKAGQETSWGKFDAALWPEKFPAAFIMDGGVISGNTARDSGGGVYVASSGVNLKSGLIDDNKVYRNYGGGIYVASVPYTMETGPLSINGNHATQLGGGMWFCPTGDAEITLDDGAIFYNNTSDGAADDLATVRNWYGRYAITVDDRALGGGLANWHKDGAQQSVLSDYGYPDKTVPRYADEADEQHTPVSNIKNSRAVYSLKSIASDTAIAAGEAYATLRVTNNKAPRGGGIGSNGGVSVGTEVVPLKLAVKKVWDESPYIELGIPESITVYLVSAGQRIESVELTAENEWKGTFENLPTNINFTVEEDVPAGWKATYGSISEADEFGNTEATITNAPVTGNVKVSKQAVFGGQAAELPGATLTVRDAEGKVVIDALTGEELSWISGEEPREFSLAPGNYTLTEDAAPAGYDIAQEVAFVIDGEGKLVASEDAAEGVHVNGSAIVLTDKLTQREVLISKVEFGQGDELADAHLTLVGTDINGNEVEKVEWVSGGTPKTFSLPAGTYTLTEDQAPLGYEKAESITFVVEFAENDTLVVTIDGEDVSGKVVMEDSPVVPEEPEEPKPTEPEESEEPEPTEPTEPKKPEPTEPEKPEPTKPSEPEKPEPVEPVEPEKPEPAKPVKPVEPTEPAEPETPGPPEPQTPEGSEKPATPEEPVAPEEPATPLNPPATPEEPVVPEQPVVPEELVTYKVTINKVDDEGNPVAGVWFGMEKKLYRPDGATYIPVGPTDENGIAVFEDYLPEAEYVIYEVEAPEGYIMDETVYDVVFDKDGSFTLQVVNKKKSEETIEIDTPETPMNPSTPEEPVKPEQPTKPEQPATPEQPVVPAKPTTPVKPATPVVANPTPSMPPRVVSGSATADAVSLLSFAGLAGFALVGAVGMFASRRKKHS